MVDVEIRVESETVEGLRKKAQIRGAGSAGAAVDKSHNLDTMEGHSATRSAQRSASFRAHWFSLSISESDKFELVDEMNLILSCGVMKFGHTQLILTP